MPSPAMAKLSLAGKPVSRVHFVQRPLSKRNTPPPVAAHSVFPFQLRARTSRVEENTVLFAGETAGASGLGAPVQLSSGATNRRGKRSRVITRSLFPVLINPYEQTGSLWVDACPYRTVEKEQGEKRRVSLLAGDEAAPLLAPIHLDFGAVMRFVGDNEMHLGVASLPLCGNGDPLAKNSASVGR